MKVAAPALRSLLACPSRYTRRVSWRHRISLVVVMVLTALPVSGTVCAMVCASAAASMAVTHHHHGAEMSGEENAAPASGPELRGSSKHDCSDHQTALREAATTTATRADELPGPSLLAAVPVHDRVSTLADPDAVFDYRTPPRSTPPTASPLVLRV